jgi:division protein CdvB (Snf7/Vps24/ESCRT-III family)
MDRKTYKFVGVSRNPDGVLAVRYANDAGRARHLQRVGHTEVLFLEMEQPERVEELMDAMMDYVELNERLDLLDVVREEAGRVGFAV